MAGGPILHHKKRGDHQIESKIVCDEWQVASVCDGNGENCIIKSITCTSWHYEQDGPGGGGGGSGGGGSGGGSSGPFPDPCAPCDPTMPCDNTGGTPTGCHVDPPPPPEDPCEYDNPPEYCSVEIIVEPSFANNSCLSSVYNKAGQTPEFENILQNFDGEFSVANLILSVGVEPGYENANAVTYPPSNFNIEVKFNPNKLNRPSLDVARTLIHELIHAEMYRKLLSAAQEEEIPWSESLINSIRNDFPGIYDYYRRYKDWQHQQMAQHYRGIIKEGLKDFDNSLSDYEYEALAWSGLMGSGEQIDPNTGLPSNPTVAWENLSKAERLSYLNTRSSYIDNNPKCQ